MNEFETELRLRVAALAAQQRYNTSFGPGTGWELEAHLGHGSHGITVLLRDSDPFNLRSRGGLVRVHRRVVLKQSLLPELGIQDFVRETNALNFVRGKSHHAQIIASTENVAQYVSRTGIRGRIRALLRPFRNPPTNVFKIISRSGGPAILTEYIANGSLQRFSSRAQSLNYQLPNRVLWAFYFCMIRACVGMQYPHSTSDPDAGGLRVETFVNAAPDGVQPVLEGITRPQPNGFVHGDIALRNVMISFTEFPTAGAEHQIIPKLKFIDYGSSRIINDGREAARENLFQISTLMLYLINPNLPPITEEDCTIYNDILTYATGILPQGDADMFAYLDPGLRQLLAESMAFDEMQRPSIEDTFTRTQEGMRKGHGEYQGVLSEAEPVIIYLFQRLVYDSS